MVLLNDPRIACVGCRENNEEIRSLRQVAKQIVIDETHRQIGNSSELFCYVRISVIKRLIQAASYLPEGYQFCIKEGYRPLSLQKQFFEDAYTYYQTENPEKTKQELYELTCQFVAPIEVAGHITGGAVDLTLMKDGQELDMGSEFNATPTAPENLTYTNSKFISSAAKKNRAILIDCLTKAGFTNYPPEWWHWSYGDRYWGFVNQCDAIYGSMEETSINR